MIESKFVGVTGEINIEAEMMDDLSNCDVKSSNGEEVDEEIAKVLVAGPRDKALPNCDINMSEGRTRRVEVGLFRKINPTHVIYYYETFPTWLLLFDAFSCLTITIVGSKDVESFEAHWIGKSGVSTSFVRSVMEAIGLGKFKFVEELLYVPTKQLILFVSGSLEFISRVVINSEVQPVVVNLDRPFSGRLRHGRPTGMFNMNHITWWRLQHRSFGGPTNFVSLIGIGGLQVTSPIGTGLRRCIKDIFNAGERPQALTGKALEKLGKEETGTVSSRLFYVIQDTIDIDRLELPVYHTTRFFANSWGQRRLTMDELGAAYGYPRQYYSELDYTVLRQPPYQVLFDVFRTVLEGLTPPTAPCVPISLTVQTPTPGMELTKSWIHELGVWLPHSWTGEATVLQKVTKHDEASVPHHMWDARVTMIYPNASLLLPLLRKLCLSRFRHNIVDDFRMYMRDSYGNRWAYLVQFFRWVAGRKRRMGGDVSLRDYLSHKECKDKWNLSDFDTQDIQEEYGRRILQDAKAGAQVCCKIANCDWWEWSSGSSLIFWRWNSLERSLARDGMKPFLHGSLPTWQLSKQKGIKEPKFSQIAKKLKTAVDRNYLSHGKVKSWTDFFEVPKGDDDIRMVYNGTSCGLNQALWAPNFWLPFPRTAARVLDYNTYSADMDVGEMFHNFPLHESLQQYSGIDLRLFHKVLQINEEDARHYRWTRTWMGARFSPYSCVRYYYLAEEFVRGNESAQANAMRWDEVLFNLPGDKNYNPSLARVRKWDRKNKRLAGDVTTYVDDGRATGSSLEHCWAILHQVNSRLQYLGIQVALRKVNAPKRSPGPWAGAVFETSSTKITRTVTAEKWKKGQQLVDELWQQLEQSDWKTKPLSYKELEITRGFLGHLSMTFETLVPYLKGFHLTLASLLKLIVQSYSLRVLILSLSN